MKSRTRQRLHFHFSLSCIGEGNGNPLQCSCLENPRDGGAWWAAVCGSHTVGHDWSDLAAPVAAAAAALVTLLYSFTEKNYFILLAINSLTVMVLYLRKFLNLNFPRLIKNVHRT